MRKVFLAALCAAVMWATPGEVQAAPFSFNWTDTVGEGGLLPTGASVGDSFTFTIVVDNGGLTTVSQTWTTADFVSASISINGGSYTATSTSISGLGVFQTDAGSAVIDSPEWSHYPGNGVDSNGLTDLAWWINGRNAIWYSPSGVNIGATNVEGNLNPANWSIGDAPSEVPEPSTWLLFGAGLAMAAIRRRNHTRS